MLAIQIKQIAVILTNQITYRSLRNQSANQIWDNSPLTNFHVTKIWNQFYNDQIICSCQISKFVPFSINGNYTMLRKFRVYT